MIDLIIKNFINETKASNPLVHCITNPISVNQCANAILSLGARPVMAQHPMEVAEITETADAVFYNLGSITDDTMAAIEISVKSAQKSHIPSVLDLVGISCSSLRHSFAEKLINETSFSVIKGNYSEVKSLYDSKYKLPGIDADINLDLDDISRISAAIALKYNAVVMASGKTDIITDGKNTSYIKNGTPYLAKITGTGCMLGAICSSFISHGNTFEAAVYSCAFLGICGELADDKNGSGSFFINLMNNISLVTDDDIKKYIKSEEVTNYGS